MLCVFAINEMIFALKGAAIESKGKGKGKFRFAKFTLIFASNLIRDTKFPIKRAVFPLIKWKLFRIKNLSPLRAIYSP